MWKLCSAIIDHVKKLLRETSVKQHFSVNVRGEYLFYFVCFGYIMSIIFLVIDNSFCVGVAATFFFRGDNISFEVSEAAVTTEMWVTKDIVGSSE